MVIESDDEEIAEPMELTSELKSKKICGSMKADVKLKTKRNAFNIVDTKGLFLKKNYY